MLKLNKIKCFDKQGGCGKVFYAHFRTYDRDDPDQPCPYCGGTECWGMAGNLEKIKADEIDYFPSEDL